MSQSSMLFIMRQELEHQNLNDRNMDQNLIKFKKASSDEIIKMLSILILLEKQLQIR